MPCVALVPMRSFRRQLRAKRQQQRLAKKEKRLNVKAEKLARRTSVKLQKKENREVVKAAQLALKQERQAQKQAKAQKQLSLQAVVQNSSVPTTSATKPTIDPDAPQLMYDGFAAKIPHQRKSFLTANTQLSETVATTATTTSLLVNAFDAQQSAQKVLTTKQAPRFFARKKSHPSRSELINAESRLGSQIFGPIPAGHRREFFHDQRNVWIWYEDWIDDDNHFQQMTVRYEVRPTGIYKKIAAGHYVRLKTDEQENFRHAAHIYLRLVKQQLYNFI